MYLCITIQCTLFYSAYSVSNTSSILCIKHEIFTVEVAQLHTTPVYNAIETLLFSAN